MTATLTKGRAAQIRAARRWTDAPQIFEGQTVFVIGGGPSLKDFKFECLRHRAVLGCNDAYTLHHRIHMDAMCFWDKHWLSHHRGALLDWTAATGGYAISCCSTPPHSSSDWVKWFEHYPMAGICQRPGYISGSLKSVGAAAINVAYHLGADRVVLLGYDFKLGADGDGNWHANKLDGPSKDVFFKKFLAGFEAIAHTLAVDDIDMQVWNAGPDSDLPTFQRARLGAFL